MVVGAAAASQGALHNDRPSYTCLTSSSRSTGKNDDPDMRLLLLLALILLSVFWFLLSTNLAVIRAKQSVNRDEKTEALGAIVPAVGALICVAGMAKMPSVLGITLAIIGGIQVVLGRAIYENFVFRK